MLTQSNKRSRPARPTALRRSVEAFLARTGMAPSRFGLLACRDANFCFQLERGREPRSATVAAVQRFMRTHSGKASNRRRSPSKPPGDGRACSSRP